MDALTAVKELVSKKFPNRIFGGAYDYDATYMLLDLPLKNADDRINDVSNTSYILLNKKDGKDWRWFTPTENPEKFQAAKTMLQNSTTKRGESKVNDNQYLSHGSAIVCHAGVKGMKWGKHLKSAGEWIDKNITGASAKKAMNSAESWHAQMAYDTEKTNRLHGGSLNRDYSKEGEEQWRKIDAKNNQRSAQRVQGAYNALQTAKAKEYAGKQQYNKSLAGKISNAPKNISNAIGNGYKIVKTKAGQLFGKPKATSSTVTHRNDGKGNWSVTRREGNGLIQNETKISSVQGRPLTAYTSSDGRIILRDDKKGRKR